MLKERNANPPESFVDWLAAQDPAGEFFKNAEDPKGWRIERPWFRVPKSKGGLRSFTEKLNGGMLRRIDKATSAKPVFAVSGIPGVVGSATREIWKELVPHISGSRNLAIWPFDGDMDSLAAEGKVVLCEIYPGLAYAAALADDLPTGRIQISKSKPCCREMACDRLSQAEWVKSERVDLGDLEAAKENENDFDALFTAAAFIRCFLEGREIANPEWIDSKVEGSMLFAGPVDPSQKSKKLC